MTLYEGSITLIAGTLNEMYREGAEYYVIVQEYPPFPMLNEWGSRGVLPGERYPRDALWVRWPESESTPPIPLPALEQAMRNVANLGGRVGIAHHRRSEGALVAYLILKPLIGPERAREVAEGYAVFSPAVRAYLGLESGFTYEPIPAKVEVCEPAALPSTPLVEPKLPKGEESPYDFLRRIRDQVLSARLGPKWADYGYWQIVRWPAQDLYTVSGVGGECALEVKDGAYQLHFPTPRGSMTNDALSLDMIEVSVKWWFRLEANLASLLNALNIPLASWQGGYEVGDILVDYDGYVLPGRKAACSLEEAIGYALG